MHSSGTTRSTHHPASASAAIAQPPRPRPLLLPAIALIAGIALSEATGPLVGTARCAALALPSIAFLLLLVLRRTARRLLLVGLVVALALAVGFLRHQSTSARSADHIVNALGDEPTLTRLTGHIVSTPIERPPLKLNPFLPFDASPRTQFVLALQELRADDPPTPATGNVRVSVEAAGLALRLGQHVQLTGRIYRPSGPRNPGETDWARWYRRQGIDAGLTVEGAAHVLALPEPASWTYRAVNAARSWARGMLLEPYADLETDPSARLLDVMILGQRSTADHALNEAFLRAGGMHFLAVSGFNVMVLAGSAWWAVRRLLGGGDRIAAAAAVLATLLFALVTEPNAPILRATIAVVVVATARATKRPICALNSLALAAACILIWDPNSLFGAAFQLTFVQVFVLIELIQRANRAVLPPRFLQIILHPGVSGTAVDEPADDVRPPEAQTKRELCRLLVVSWAVGLLLICVCTWASAMPLVLLHFGRVAPWGWLGTVPLTPVVTLVTMLSVAKVVVSGLLPPLGALLGLLLGWSTDLLLWSVGLFEHMPGAKYETQPPPVWLVLASYAVLLALVYLRPWRDSSKPDRARGAVGGCNRA